MRVTKKVTPTIEKNDPSDDVIKVMTATNTFIESTEVHTHPIERM